MGSLQILSTEWNATEAVSADRMSRLLQLHKIELVLCVILFGLYMNMYEARYNMAKPPVGDACVPYGIPHLHGHYCGRCMGAHTHHHVVQHGITDRI